MKQLRIGILDFYNIQMQERQTSVFYREKGAYLKKTERALTLLSNAAKSMGHIPVVYYPEHCQMYLDNNGFTKILYKGHPMKGCDVLIPRINVVTHVELEVSLIKQFQLMGVPVLNKYMPIMRSLNKLRAQQILNQAKIPLPRTILVRKLDYLDEAIRKVGGYPVIIKSPFGTHGKGVAIIESRRSLYSAMDIIWRFSGSTMVLIQEYVAEAFGSDYRAFVIGDKVVAAMKRTAPKGDFRSNLNLGGDAIAVELTAEEEKMAIKATKALGLESCGVDMLRSSKGPVVMELNPCAGLSGITKATEIDISRLMIECAVGLVRKK